jgi:hypothetical protein
MFVNNPRIVTDGAVFVGDALMPSISEPGTRLYNGAGINSADVKLLIHGDAGSGQNFTDSSLSNHTVTAVGNTTHSTAQTKFSGGSIYFGGTTDYLSVPDSSDWAFGTDDFTIDFWFNPTSFAAYTGLIVQNPTTFGSTDSSNGLFIEVDNSSTKLRLFIRDGSDMFAEISQTGIVAGTWNHVAVVRETGANKISMYLNGQSCTGGGNPGGSGSSVWSGSTSYPDFATPLLIGVRNDQSDYFNGYMDEVRITKGAALWAQNFTPPVRRDTLSISDGMMYNGSCISLDGGDENVNCGNASDLDVTTGSFTIIGWINNNDIGNYDVIVQKGNAGHGSSPGYRLRWEGVTDLNKLMFICTQSSSYAEDNVLTADALAQDTWYQVAITRNAGLLSIYIDGALNNSKSTAITGTLTNSEHFVLGYDKYNDSAYFNGQMADWKFFNTALSAANIKELYDDSRVIIPTKNDASGGFVSQSNLKLSLSLSEGAGVVCYDGSGNGNHGTFTNADSSGDWLTGQTGAPQLVEGYNRKLYFSGDDYVDCGGNSSLNFTVQNFSISCWIFIHDITDVGYIVRRGGWGSNGWYTYLDSSGRVQIYTNDSTQGDPHTQTISNSSVITENTWHHVVWVRNGATGVIYVDGTDETASGDSMIDAASSPANCYIGSPTNFIKGIVDEVIVYDEVVTSSQAAALHATDVNGGPLPPDPMSGASSLPSTSNVVSYWRNEGSGTWTDRGNNSNDGTPVGTFGSRVFFKQGINGSKNVNTGRDNQGFPLLYQNNGAIGFNGSDDYVNLGTGSDWTVAAGEDVSLFAWIKTTQSTEAQIVRVSYTSPYLILGIASGKLRASIHDGTTGANDENNNGQTVNDGVWHYVGVVFNRDSNLVFYKDGVSATGVDISSVTGSITTPNPYAAMGRRPNGAHYFNGQIANATFYKRALTYAEIQQNYKSFKARFGK